MTYKILSVKNEEQIIIMNVEYTLDDLSKLVIDVPVFAPSTVEEIAITLANRGMSEQARIIATSKVLEIMHLIPLNTEIPIIVSSGTSSESSSGTSGDSGTDSTSGDAGTDSTSGDPV